MYDSIRGVLVIIFGDVRTHGDDVVLLIIECNLNTTLFCDLILLIECSKWKTTPTLNAKIGEHYD